MGRNHPEVIRACTNCCPALLKVEHRFHETESYAELSYRADPATDSFERVRISDLDHIDAEVRKVGTAAQTGLESCNARLAVC